MMGEVETFQTTVPFTAPITPPISTPHMNARGRGIVLASIAVSTAVKPTAEPTERSMFPVIMRMVMPTPVRATNAMLVSEDLEVVRPPEQVIVEASDEEQGQQDGRNADGLDLTAKPTLQVVPR